MAEEGWCPENGKELEHIHIQPSYNSDQLLLEVDDLKEADI